MMIKKNVVFLFPGQGSQSVGMCVEWAEKFPLVKDLFLKASKILDKDLWEMVVKGPEEILNQTINTQPVMLTADFAMWRIWQKKGEFMPSMMAGHSLGEYAALVAANAIDFEEAVLLVAKRAELMQKASDKVKGGMAVFLALDDETVKEICEKAAQGEVLEPANFNVAGQVVIAGMETAIERAIELAKQAGAKRAKKYPISVPSHCALMQPAAEELAVYLKGVSVQTPKIPVINNVDLAIYQEPEAIKDALVRQLYKPIYWEKLIHKMIAKGIDTLIECGPKKVLTAINKRIDPELKRFALDDIEDFNQLIV